jgi:raffinose/stachyose/melibiose transport system substrate-binding protein
MGRRSARHAALAVVAGTTVLLAAACGGGGGSTSSSTNGGGAAAGPKTLTWWHNATTDPGKSAWAKVASDFQKTHPNVKFTINPLQNEQFNSKVPAALESNNPPDIYQQWGGGAEATQAESGKLMDLTPQVGSWIDQLGPSAKGWQIDGKWYGVPYGYHLVGFWYRTDLFQKAGISSPPTTMDELNADIAKLKAAGITPVAVGSKDRWPDAFYYDYFVLRECPQNTLTSAVKQASFDDPCFTKAGNDLKAFLDTKPFQEGFLGTPAQQGAGSSAGMVANAKAAMELTGDWEMLVTPSLASDKNFASKMGWFPFPSVPGGGGDQSAGLGGGDGFSCTVNATSACPEFLKYLTSPEVQSYLVKQTAIALPVNPQANSAVTHPAVKSVLAALGKVSYNQLYFDQALSTSAGQALNSAVADFFAGQGTPESIAQSVSG